VNQPVESNRPPRILVVRGGAIGDFILTLPAIGALRGRWPDAHIEILGYSHIIELARGRYYADAVRSIEARAMAGFFVPNGLLDAALSAYFRSFDLVVSYLFDPDHIFADNVRRCGARQVIEASPRPHSAHAAEHYCKPLETLAIYVETAVPRLFLTEEDRAAAGRWLGNRGTEPLVAVHPGSGSDRKNWPAEKFAVVARWLVEKRGAQLLVVQGEADTTVVGEFLRLIKPQTARIAVGLNLVELAALLEQCVLFLGNDSGITHMAAAVGIPTIALFGPFSFPIWKPRPWRAEVRVIAFGDEDVTRVCQAVNELWPPQNVVD